MITVYQKPTCTKCRIALKQMREHDVDFKAINYYEKPLTAHKLKELHQKMGKSPWQTVRSNEPAYKELGLGKKKKDMSDDELFKIMAKHPDLIQRPIVEIDDTAYIARDNETLNLILRIQSS